MSPRMDNTATAEDVIETLQGLFDCAVGELTGTELDEACQIYQEVFHDLDRVGIKSIERFEASGLPLHLLKNSYDVPLDDAQENSCQESLQRLRKLLMRREKENE